MGHPVHPITFQYDHDMNSGKLHLRRRTFLPKNAVIIVHITLLRSCTIATTQR